MTPEQRDKVRRLAASYADAVVANRRQILDHAAWIDGGSYHEDCQRLGQERAEALAELEDFISSLTSPPWTSEAPKVAGWYWWRGGPKVGGFCVKVLERDGVLVAAFIDGSESALGSFAGQWSGPIPEPPEGEK